MSTEIQVNNVNDFNQLEDSSGVVLSAEQAGGKVAIQGKANFPKLIEPDGAPGNPPKWSCDILVPKGSEAAKLLFAAAIAVGNKVWKGEADHKLGLAAFALANGFGGMDGSKISIYDGDLNPEWEAGMWRVGCKAPYDAAKGGADRPVCLVRQGAVPVVANDPSEFPKHGDGVTLIVDVWAQAPRDRINLRCLGVIREIVGQVQAGPSPEQVAAIVSGVAGATLPPPAIPGVVPQTGGPSTQALPAGQPAQPQAAAPQAHQAPVYQPTPPAAPVAAPAAPAPVQEPVVENGGGPTLVDI